ncbi:ankyrin repeat domain-containing protein [Ottowia sp. GY511]|uniref:ankyrin repeat domain-containing protein n=1 Tax=Ottowia TaxID=219181 RepID=UPI0011C97CB2|nr:ankyrin repeat domain-containing protein [Ottowia sp. GY511]TXK33694.1 ankyrin repeat domain-containing protein [Ottowia sp. GY511]
MDLLNKIVDKRSDYEVAIDSGDFDLNQMGAHGRTPLMAAAAFGNLSAVKRLIGKGALLEVAGRLGFNPLHEAAVMNQVEVIEFLLSVGAHVNALTDDGSTPLIMAASWGSLDALAALLDNGAEPNLKTVDGLTAIDCALEKGEDVAAQLIAARLKEKQNYRNKIQ